MSEPTQVSVIPEDQYITLKELCDEDNEIIFVQHSKEIPADQISKELFQPTSKKSLLISSIASQIPVYPVAFDDGKIHIARPVDGYYIATKK